MAHSGYNRFLFLLVVLFVLPQNAPLRGQSFNSSKIVARDTLLGIYKMHGLPLLPAFSNSHFETRIHTNTRIELEFKPKISSQQFYNPGNVIPDNPFMLDYRSGSYYTPKIVQDRLDFFMNRPRADSFVPIPVVAILAAKLAMKYIDIEKKLEIHAEDYLLNDSDLCMMKELWTQSPKTLEDLYRIAFLHEHATFETLTSDMNRLVDCHLVKRREIEAGPTQYFAAQSRQEVILLLQEKLHDSSLTPEQRNKISALLTQLRN